MATEEAVRQHGQGEDDPRGLLFRLSARLGLLLFVGVLAVSVDQGVAVEAAIIRGLLALLALTACGWMAEQVAGMNRNKKEAEPEQVQAEAKADEA
ncbi:MAG: hypothetical protein HYX51_04260 [Chloroflexi bacterium]|nr:hypothetical protein [Chloroflexota bacterium]